MFSILKFFKSKKEEERSSLLAQISAKLDEIRDWNEKTFPEATLGGQLEKLEEEFAEMFEASEAQDHVQTIAEGADVFIVLGGLRRFESQTGIFAETEFCRNLTLRGLKRLLNAIDKKMEINRKRKWKKTGKGKYHH